MGILDFGDNIIEEIQKVTNSFGPISKSSQQTVETYRQLADNVQNQLISTLDPYKNLGLTLNFYFNIILPLIVLFLIIFILCKLKELLFGWSSSSRKHKSN